MQTEIESQFDRMSHVRTYQKTYWQKRKFFTPAWFHISVRTKRYIWMDAAYATCQFQKISGSNKAHTLYGFKLHREIPFLFFLLLSFLYFLGPFLFHLVFFSLFIFFTSLLRAPGGGLTFRCCFTSNHRPGNFTSFFPVCLEPSTL